MHSIAVNDRVNMTTLSEDRAKPVEHKPSDLLPSADDILMSRQVKEGIWSERTPPWLPTL
jgi:hypothetical protein